MNIVNNYFSNGGTHECRIDYYFARGITVNDVKIPQCTFSDHYPIILKYTNL